MILATSITQSHLDKSQPYFQSAIKYFTGRKICFTINFTCQIEGWETIQVKPECKWRPTNRDNYYSLQHGEFIKYLNVEPDEVILFTDSDIILQRPFDLDFPDSNAVFVTQCSFPQLKLFEVVRNLKCSKRPDKFFAKYHVFSQREFCACFIMAKASTWKAMYNEAVKIYDMLNNFKHHAAWQLLINIVVYNDFNCYLLPSFVCNASWYDGTSAISKDGILYEMSEGVKDGEPVMNSEVVYFNHTKFEHAFWPINEHKV